MIEVKPHNTVTCISHVDNDGKFCAFLVKRKYPQTRVYLTNYGKQFDEACLGDITFVTDFSFDSIEVLQRISTKTQLVWIDHHPVIDEASKVNFIPEGLRSKSVSAAMLTWQYLYPNEPIPAAIQYVSDYDTWKWDKNINALYFHYGLGMMDLLPNDKKTDRVVNQILTDPDYVERICIIGKKIDNYISVHNKIVVDDGAFSTELDGVKALACNLKNSNSLLFDSMNERYKDYPYRILFSYFANIGKYRVSIFTIDDKYPVNLVARKYGGGGHPSAAGFTCDVLPFKTPDTFDKPNYENILKPMFELTFEDPIVKRYSNTGYVPLVWSHQYPAIVAEKYSSVCINHPTASLDAFYITGLSNMYTLGVFYFMTNTGWYRYRIYILDPRLDINEVCESIDKKLEYEHTPCKVVGNSIWTYCKQPPAVLKTF